MSLNPNDGTQPALVVFLLRWVTGNFQGAEENFERSVGDPRPVGERWTKGKLIEASPVLEFKSVGARDQS